MKIFLIACLLTIPASKAYCDFCWGADRQEVRAETGTCETSQQSYDRQADERQNELRNSDVRPHFDDDDNNSSNSSTPTQIDLPKAAKRTPGIYSAYIDCYASLEGDARTIGSKAQYYDGIWSKYSGEVYMSLATNYEDASSKMLEESPLLVLTDTSLRTNELAPPMSLAARRKFMMANLRKTILDTPQVLSDTKRYATEQTASPNEYEEEYLPVLRSAHAGMAVCGRIPELQTVVTQTSKLLPPLPHGRSRGK